MAGGDARDLLPRVTGEEGHHATWDELFFDLVFVAAVAALAGELHAAHSASGLAAFAGLFVPVWWAWRGYTWYAAAFDTGDRVFRFALLAAMAGAGALAAGVHGAAHEHSDTFVVAYGGLFLLLSALYARMWRRQPDARPHAIRYASGNALGAAMWLASLAVDEGTRPLVWGLAMVVLIAPAVAVLALPYRAFADAGHIAERYGLFTIIVLGESVVRTIAGLPAVSRAAPILVALAGFVVAATIWWVYFARFRSMPRVSRRARFVWAQAHLLVFAGIAATAVGVELLVEAAAHGRSPALDDRLPLGAGLALYLVGMATIRAATRRGDAVVLLRCVVAAALLAVALGAGGVGALVLVTVMAAMLLAEAALELNRAPPTD